MYRLRFIAIILVSSWSCAHAASYGYQKTLYAGAIVFPSTFTSQPRLTGYYKGARVSISNDRFEIKEYPNSPGFYFLFTLSPITPKTDLNDPNTIQHFQLAPDGSYACFKVMRVRSDKMWHIERVTLTQNADKTCRIPENSIILPFDPEYIEELRFDRKNSLYATTLPTTKLKEDIPQHKMNEMVLRATLVALDLNPFHRKPTVIQSIKRDAPNIVMSMVTE